MIYLLTGLLILVVIWALLIYLRKTMWDAVHRNLLDMEDHYEGRVMRASFANRPYFHGKMGTMHFTINFSSAKIDGQRVTYIDCSIEQPTAVSFSLTAKQWLEKQNAGETQDNLELQSQSGQVFIIRPASDEKVRQFVSENIFQEFLEEFPDLAYFFAGQSGIICEWMTAEVIKATEFENINARLQIIKRLGEQIAQ